MNNYTNVRNKDFDLCLDSGTWIDHISENKEGFQTLQLPNTPSDIVLALNRISNPYKMI